MSTAVPAAPAPPPSSAEAVAALAARVAGMDPGALDEAQLTEFLQACHRLASAAEGATLAAAAALARHSGDRDHGPMASEVECASAQVSLALRLTPRGADRLVDHGLDLSGRLPATLAALRAGDIDGVRAKILAEATANLSPELVAGVEQRALPFASRLTPGQFRARVLRMVIEADPDAAKRRHREAVKQRRVGLWDEGDSTSALAAFGLSADTAHEAYAYLDALARHIKHAGSRTAGDGAEEPDGPTSEHRNLDQIRADVFADLLRGRFPTIPEPEFTPTGADAARTPQRDGRQDSPAEPPTGTQPPVGPRTTAENVCELFDDLPEPGPHPHPDSGTAPDPAPGFTPVGRLHLTIPFATLIGDGQEPGHLAGYGPLLADIAQQLAERAQAQASLHCWSVLDENGRPLAHGTTRYRPSPRMRAEIEARDQVCQFPTCTHPAARCDLDHTIPFDPDDPAAQTGGGATCPCNVVALCRRHHRLKQHYDWTVDHPTPGHLSWTDPTGHTHPPPQIE